MPHKLILALLTLIAAGTSAQSFAQTEIRKVLVECKGPQLKSLEGEVMKDPYQFEMGALEDSAYTSFLGGMGLANFKKASSINQIRSFLTNAKQDSVNLEEIAEFNGPTYNTLYISRERKILDAEVHWDDGNGRIFRTVSIEGTKGYVFDSKSQLDDWKDAPLGHYLELNDCIWK